MQIEYSQLPVEEAQIADYLLRMCGLYDQERTGRLHLVELAAAMRESELGLSQLQLQAVLSEANADDEDGTVSYRDFAVAAAGLISASAWPALCCCCDCCDCGCDLTCPCP